MSTQRLISATRPPPMGIARLLHQQEPVWRRLEQYHPPTPARSCSTASAARIKFYLAWQLFPVKPDDMVIQNPQVEHTELSLNASPLEYLSCWAFASMGFLFSKADTNYAIFGAGRTGADGHVAAHAAGRGRPQRATARPFVRTC